MNRILFFSFVCLNLPLLSKNYWEMYCVKETRTSTFMEFDTLKEVDQYMYKYNLEKVYIRKCGDTAYTGYCPKTKDCSEFGTSRKSFGKMR